MLGSPVPRVANGITRILVGDGRWVTIRPVEQGDRDDLLRFYQSLSSDTRYARFMSLGTLQLASAAEHFAAADHRTAEGFVAVLGEAGPSDGAIVGHLCMEQSAAGRQEIAVVVADHLHGRGIGSALMRQAIASARRRHVRRLTADMFGTNQPMRRLMLDAGAEVVADRLDGGVESIELRVAGRSAQGDRRTVREDPGRARRFPTLAHSA